MTDLVSFELSIEEAQQIINAMSNAPLAAVRNTYQEIEANFSSAFSDAKPQDRRTAQLTMEAVETCMVCMANSQTWAAANDFMLRVNAAKEKFLAAKAAAQLPEQEASK